MTVSLVDLLVSSEPSRSVLAPLRRPAAALTGVLAGALAARFLVRGLATPDPAGPAGGRR